MAKQEVFRAMLHTIGRKATPSRLSILAMFKKARRPLSAQEIIHMLLETVDQATVYRTLTSLKEKGIIKQVDLRHNHAHYELANLTEHHHLICTHCGKVEDVHRHCGVEEIQSAILRSSKHFANIQEHALEFYGVCILCSKKKSYIDIYHAEEKR